MIIVGDRPVNYPVFRPDNYHVVPGGSRLSGRLPYFSCQNLGPKYCKSGKFSKNSDLKEIANDKYN